jgi:hypothetical protein
VRRKNANTSLPGLRGLEGNVVSGQDLRLVGSRCSFDGKPIRIASLASLMAWKGKLLSGGSRGTAVHAGSFLRERRIVLDAGLRGPERRRILLHELFHFAWIRLSNSQRASWTALLDRELQANARGELGWSAEWRKAELAGRRGHRFRREYVCESFCDSAAWHYGGIAHHGEFTLALRWCALRAGWFNRTFPENRVKV